MTFRKHFFWFFIITLPVLFTGCKYLQDTTLGKYYHNLTAHYNVYFNANETLKQVVVTTENAHVDDYNKILDVYQFATDDVLKKNSAQADNILKKCSKLQEKHPGSNWIPDAYLLVGKAYFFKADYYSAMETFQYLQSKYKSTTIAYESMIWYSLCLLRLGKYDDAQAQLSMLSGEGTIPQKILKEYYLTSAFVSIKVANYPSAIENIKKAIPREHKRNYKTRYYFILAQLYKETDHLTEAASNYKLVIKRNPVYDMTFNAQINLSHCYDLDNEKNVKMIRNQYLHMVKDEKNIQYLDQLYFELALLELKLGNQKDMEKYLRLSLANSKGNQNQKALTFKMLGDYYYEHSNYIYAKIYYDSCSVFVSETLPDYKKFTKRIQNVSKLVENLVVVQTEDSLLYLASLTKQKLDSTIDKAFKLEQKRIKEKNEQEKIVRQNEEQQNSLNDQLIRTNNQLMPPVTNNTSNWYFSNPQIVKLGIAQFSQRWEKRKLEDDWRRKKKSNSSITMDNGENKTDPKDTINDKSDELVLTQDEIRSINDRIKDIPQEKQKYYKDIPFTKKLQEISKNKIIVALKNAADIYLEDLGDTIEAIKTYEKLIARFPNNKFEAETHYKLFLLYRSQKNIERSNFHKNIIINSYPESDYALLINNPDYFKNRLEIQNLTAKNFYKTLYGLFEKGDCKTLIDSMTHAKQQFNYTVYYPKMIYLRIICEGKDTTRQAFIAMLNDFVKKYNRSEVAPHAQNLINYLEQSDSVSKPGQKKTNIQVTPYTYNDKSSYYLAVPVTNDKVKTLTNSFSNYNKEFHGLEELLITSVILSDKIQLILIKEFPDKKEGMKYLNEINTDKNFKQRVDLGNAQSFIISVVNMATLIKLKDVDQYLDFFKTNYK